MYYYYYYCARRHIFSIYKYKPKFFDGLERIFLNLVARNSFLFLFIVLTWLYTYYIYIINRYWKKCFLAGQTLILFNIHNLYTTFYTVEWKIDFCYTKIPRHSFLSISEIFILSTWGIIIKFQYKKIENFAFLCGKW